MDAGLNDRWRPNTGLRSACFCDDVADLEHFPKLVIGRIHGNAFDGVVLAPTCDEAAGVEGALMGFVETKFGLITATVGPYHPMGR